MADVVPCLSQRLKISSQYSPPGTCVCHAQMVAQQGCLNAPCLLFLIKPFSCPQKEEAWLQIDSLYCCLKSSLQMRNMTCWKQALLACQSALLTSTVQQCYVLSTLHLLTLYPQLLSRDADLNSCLSRSGQRVQMPSSINRPTSSPPDRVENMDVRVYSRTRRQLDHPSNLESRPETPFRANVVGIVVCRPVVM